MLNYLADAQSRTGPVTPLIPVHAGMLADWLKGQASTLQAWTAQTDFKAKPGTFSLVPKTDCASAR